MLLDTSPTPEPSAWALTFPHDPLSPPACPVDETAARGKRKKRRERRREKERMGRVGEREGGREERKR